MHKIEKDSETEEENLVQINFDDDNKRISTLEHWKFTKKIFGQKKIAHDIDDIFNMWYLSTRLSHEI